ncbi:MAG TPA: hemerythrin [Nitrospiraceae bacterium]|nr:hemerythrin [Nitrospiraceae bacterium]
MALIVWNEKFSVNVKEIDEQHKKLFNMINDLDDAINAHRTTQVLSKTLDDMINYTVTHFGIEENYMKDSDYPEFPEHKKAHDEFTFKVKRLQKDFAAGREVFSLDVMNILKDWLSNHILFMDRKYMPFLSNKGFH